MTKQEIAVIPTGEKNAIKVTLVAHDEKYFVDIRHIFKDDSGKWIHTKKGIHVPVDIALKVEEALKEALLEEYQRVRS